MRIEGLRQQENSLAFYQENPRTYYRDAIKSIDRLANSEFGINLVFVGGTFTDFINPTTQFTVSSSGRTIQLHNHNDLNPYRKNNTVKDLDAVCFHPDRELTLEFMRTLDVLAKWDKDRGLPVPPISIEPTYFHGRGWPERRDRLQLVSTIDARTASPFLDHDALYLKYDKIEQPINWKSVEPWRVVLSDGTSFPTLNPFGHALRYCMRVASGPKMKDRQTHEVDGFKFSKMSLLMTMAKATHRAGLEAGIDYTGEEYFGSWFEFIRELRDNPDPIIRLKAKAADFFWNTLGTTLSQGVGPAKHLASLATKFTG